MQVFEVHYVTFVINYYLFDFFSKNIYYFIKLEKKITKHKRSTKRIQITKNKNPSNIYNITLIISKREPSSPLPRNPIGFIIPSLEFVKKAS